MSVDNLISKLAEQLGAAGFGAKVNLNMGDAGVVHIDGTQNPPAISQGEADADGSINMSLENFLALADGSLDPMGAFIYGTMSIDGDMGAIIKLQGALGG